MEIRHLTGFVAVAEELHFGRAAERLHMAQSPLSQQIKGLERELGARLFERSTRSVRLTPAGEALLVPARVILDQVDTARRVVRSAHMGEVGRVTVGFAGASGNSLMPVLTRAVAAAHPGIELALRGQIYSGDAVTRLQNGSLDLGIVSLPVPAGLAHRPVRVEPLVVALPSDHPLAQQDAVAPSELADEPFITFPAAQGSAVREAMLNLCRGAGFAPNIVQEAPDSYSLVAMVAARVGISVVVGSNEHLQLPQVAYRPFSIETTALPIALAWDATNASPALRAVLDAAEDALPTPDVPAP